jgi:hypothetical protein
MPTFDWRTDTGEPDAPLVASSDKTRPSRWRAWLEISLIVALVALFTYQQVNRWLETVAANIRESPRATFLV